MRGRSSMACIERPFFDLSVIPGPLDRIYVMAMERATPNSQVTEAEKHILDWDRIYLDLAPRVYNYFRYRLGQERDVEDLTSRAFEKAWAAREQYRRDLAGFRPGCSRLRRIWSSITFDHSGPRCPSITLRTSQRLTLPTEISSASRIY